MTLLDKNLLQLYIVVPFILKESALLFFKKGVKRRFSLEYFKRKPALQGCLKPSFTAGVTESVECAITCVRHAPPQ